ncbi:28 kDa inner dynein arm light chain [Diplonema papillatum]|nr:28 kDa inner dynein arm light chain [Diplonema papillatum]
MAKAVPTPTLVKYDAPVEWEARGGKRGQGQGYSADGRKNPRVPMADILKSVIPAREWEEPGGKRWTQLPSSAPATRLDVINLQEQLDGQLHVRRARESGVCPVRQDLYAQAFDELVREVTVDSPERGVLVLRVRDDMRQTVDAYRVMFESSTAFGTRKAVQAEQASTDLKDKVRELEKKVAILEDEHQDLQSKCEEVAKAEREKGKEEKQKFDDEMKYLKNANNQLASLLNSMLHGKSK